MIEMIETMLADRERGKLTRRQLAVSLATVFAAPRALMSAEPTGFQVQVNGPDYVGHIS